MATPWEKAQAADTITPTVSPVPGKVGSTPWEKAGGTPTVPVVPESTEPGLGDKLKGRGSAMVGHAQKVLNKPNPLTAVEYGINTVGEGAGGIGDLLSTILKPVGKVLEPAGKVLRATDEIFTPGARENWDKKIAKGMEYLSKTEAKHPAAGELIRNVGNIASVVPMGLGTKAVPGLVGASTKAIKAPITQIAGTEVVKKGLQDRALNVLHTVLRDTKKDRDDGFDAKWVLERQLGGNLEQLKKNADVYHNTLSLQLKDRMKNTGKTVDIADAWNKTMDDFKNPDKTFGQTKQIKSALQNITSEVETLVGKDVADIDVVLANDIKRLAGKNGVWSDSFDKDISAEAKVYESFYRHLKKNIEQAVPEVKDINAEFHKLIPLERVIAKRQPVKERGEIIPLKSMLNVGMAAVSGSPIPLALEVSNRMGRSGGLAQGLFNVTEKSAREKAAKGIVDIPSLVKWVEKYEPNLATTLQKTESIDALTKPITGSIKTADGSTMMFQPVSGKRPTKPNYEKIFESLEGKAAPASLMLNKEVRKAGKLRPMPKQYYENVLKQGKMDPKALKDLMEFLAGYATTEAREAVPKQEENK